MQPIKLVNLILALRRGRVVISHFKKKKKLGDPNETIPTIRI